jgi:hypothetical protein
VKTNDARTSLTVRSFKNDVITRGDRLALAIWTATRRIENVKTTKESADATRAPSRVRAPFGV